MIEVLVAGSLHLDVIVDAPRLPRLDETLMGRSVAYRLGGKGGNQAVAAARMGARTAMAGRVGSDRFSAQILAELDAAGVDRHRVEQAEGASGMSVAIVDGSGNYGAVVVSAANLDFDPPSGMVDGCTRVLCLQNEIPESANSKAALAARDAGARVILNAAPARPSGPGLLALVDILVVNRVEAEGLTGESNPEGAAQLLSKADALEVIVTLGADGLLHASHGEAPRALTAYPVRVDSTHGAGDMFVGSLATEVARGASVPDALPIAQAAAALQVSTPAAARSRINRETVLRLVEDCPGSLDFP